VVQIRFRKAVTRPARGDRRLNPIGRTIGCIIYGDEINIAEPGKNYGWPVMANHPPFWRNT
jgi:hypothetical protein